MSLIKDKVERWQGWQGSTANRRILSSVLIVVAVTLVVRVAGAAKELVVAGFFGTSSLIDAYLIALLLPVFAINVLADSFSSAVIPTYIRIRESQGDEAAHQLFSSIVVIGIFFLITASLVFLMLTPLVFPLIGSGFDEQTMSLSITLFYWLLPIIVVTGVSRIYAAIINAGEKFAVAALAPIFTPVFTIVFLVIYVDTWGVYTLIVGALLGAIIELLVLLILASRRRLPVLPRWSGMNEHLSDVVGQYMPMVAGAFLMSGTLIVDQSMAAALDPGSVATLNYANKVVSMLLGITAMALGTVVLPHFSRMVVNHDRSELLHTFGVYTRLILLISVPLTLVMIFFSESIIRLIYERGEFTVADTVLVGKVQGLYFLQTPFYILGILVVRLISSMRKNHILMWAAVISLPLNIILNYVFMQYIGVSGIALSTSIVYLVSYLFLLFNLRRSVLSY